MSNFYSVDVIVAEARLKKALEPFVGSRFNLQAAAEVHGLGDRIGEGVCLGAAMEWLLACRETTSKDQVGTQGQGHMHQRATLERIIQRQSRYEIDRQIFKDQEPPEQYLPHRPTLLAVEQNFRAEGIECKTQSGTMDHAALAEHVSLPGHHLVSLSGVNDGHAFAVVSQQSLGRTARLQVFDPNLGEFNVKLRDTPYFFEALAALYYHVGWQYQRMNIATL